jgi:hypothetical protein
MAGTDANDQILFIVGQKWITTTVRQSENDKCLFSFFRELKVSFSFFWEMSNWGHVTPGVVALAGSHNSQEHLWICFNCRARPRFFFFFTF